jgi:hypothetical protein
VFSYLLLLREYPGERIVYYGKTGDAGRDIVRTAADGTIELVQCKRYTSNVGIGEIRGELAKLCANIFSGLIPAPPARVVFYAVPDLTAPAKDLIQDRSKWLNECDMFLEEHLGEAPSAELAAFARTWWPRFDHEDESRLTERAREQQELIEEFFQMRHVITGSITELEPRLAGMEQSMGEMRDRFEGVFGGAAPAAATAGAATRTLSSAQPHPQLRVLAAKVSIFEERDRRHIDEKGQRLLEEVRSAVRELNLR